MEENSCKLSILHYNDVYNVESREKPEPIGGAARMLTAFKQFSDLNPLIIFCGDALSPSMCKYIIYTDNVNTIKTPFDMLPRIKMFFVFLIFQ